MRTLLRGVVKIQNLMSGKYGTDNRLPESEWNFNYEKETGTLKATTDMEPQQIVLRHNRRRR
jgi:hypothetical protein